eukprot:7098262-Heterocapsa_arctica.AAC.1
MKADSNFIISVVMAQDPDQSQERPGFKFFEVRHQGHSKLPSQYGVHGWQGGQHLRHKGIYWHIQRAPDR